MDLNIILIFVCFSNFCGIVFGKTPSELICENETNSTTLPFCLKESYRKEYPPFINNTPLNVSVIVVFDDIVEVSDDEYTVTFNGILALSWIDTRLQILHNSTSWEDIDEGDFYSPLNVKFLEHVWRPDLDIPNVKTFEIKKVLDTQRQFGMFRNKRISYDFPVQITLNCPNFEFSNYPFDTQFCDFLIGSYAWKTDRILYTGNIQYNQSKQRPLKYAVNYVKPLSFKDGIREFTNFYHTPNGSIKFEKEEYSHFVIKMEFTRKIQAHVISFYLPSFLVVLSSWLGFLIGTASIPGRLTVTVILLLVLINMRYNYTHTTF